MNMTRLFRNAGKALLQQRYSPRRFLWRLPAADAVVALTFDDGPDPVHTPAVLDLLASHGIKATFFVIGEKVQKHPGLIRRMVAEGHGIGGHTWSHREIIRQPPLELAADLHLCRQVIHNISGVDTTLFRPPKGLVDLASIHQVCKLGYCLVHWTKTYGDYRRDGAELLIARFRKDPPVARDIVLLHDHNKDTIAALSTQIPEWLADGIMFDKIPATDGRAARPPQNRHFIPSRMKSDMEKEVENLPGPAPTSDRINMMPALVVLIVVVIASLMLAPVRKWISVQVPLRWKVHLNGFRFDYNTDYKVRIRMADGIELASTLYLPRNRSGKIASIFVRHPYDRLSYGEGLNAAEFFARHGYAVVVQDIRGKFASQGEFMPYRSGASDGAATLDWIARQPWSNGRVGTFGCSALGELQFVLAEVTHPAHVAMIPLGAGGAVGSAGGRYSYFGLYEGGVFQLASGFGWFLDNGAKDPGAPPAPKGVDIATALQGLPLADLVKRIRPAPNGFDEFVRTPLTDSSWRTLGYVSNSDLPTIPALVINTWGDQTVGDALSLAEQIRKISPEIARNQHVVIAPGKHCNNEEAGLSGQFGDLEVKGAAQPYNDWYLRWFDYWLRGQGNGLSDLPPYLYYVIGESRWLTASTWPPEGVRMERWHLDSGGRANGRRGDGVLSREPPHFPSYDEFRYDPMNPVPSRGGPLCCSGNSADRTGPVDQRDVEARDDVLVYTSAALQENLRIAGTLQAVLNVSSSARDTDFIARLVHVWPDGRATNIQEGALRARYRNGIERPLLLEPGKRVNLMIDMRSIAYFVPKGHRLRLHVTSSSFPRLERNLNTGGRNYDESAGVIAVNRVYHDRQAPSYLELSVLP